MRCSSGSGALEHVKRAQAIVEAKDSGLKAASAVNFEFARVLWEIPGAERDRPRAVELARAAAALLAGLDDPASTDLAAIETWLAEHPA